MKIVYPYNEVLPVKKAHDAYIVRQCAALASVGHEVYLVIGQGSLGKKELFKFYDIALDNPLNIIYLPILRRQHFIRLQCNRLFFFFAQRFIKSIQPHLVLFSVLKQADYHLKRRLPSIKYLYEVHQLRWYPTLISLVKPKEMAFEKNVFNRLDGLTVTTLALKELLMHEPYKLTQPIEKLALACDFKPLNSKKQKQGHFQLYYVGQLYKQQGLKKLLFSLRNIEGLTLTIIGGTPSEIREYRIWCKHQSVLDKVRFKGFMDTSALNNEVQKADAFITTFEPVERMPFVAHTKLSEYQAWKRPIIAPKLDIVFEEVEKGLLAYSLDDPKGLEKALLQIQEEKIYQKLLNEIQSIQPLTWEKRGYLFNKILHNMFFYEEHATTVGI